MTGYRVLRGGVVVATVAAPGWSDTNYLAGATHTDAVVAFDNAGNVSPTSNVITVTLPASSGKRR